MRAVLTLAISLFCLGSLAAQDISINGRVVDKSSNNPLPGVSVFIAEMNRGVVTDLDGKFRLANLPNRSGGFLWE